MDTMKDDYSSRESDMDDDVKEKSVEPRSPVVKVKKGRGRPPKNPSNSDVGAKKGAALANGASAGVAAPKGRGRPAKVGKSKITHTIESTGRGRGRPKNPVPKSPIQQAKKDIGRKAPVKSLKKPGRPRKVVHSDEDDGDDFDSDDDKQHIDDDDEEEQRRPAGRPPTGAVNLNIVRTGRGQGRAPKKAVAKPASLKRPATIEPANGNIVPKKRGRPPLNKNAGSAAAAAVAKQSVNKKPRGRPRTKTSPTSANDSQGDDTQDDEYEKKQKLLDDDDDIDSDDIDDVEEHMTVA